MNVKDAKMIAFGSIEATSLDEYYDAWQWLYDNRITLKPADDNYMDKLICYGNVGPREGYFD